MPPLTTQLFTDPAYLGGLFVELDQAWTNLDYEPTLEAFLTDLEQFEQGLFENEKAANGEPWAPLAPSTIERKGHDVILHETGRLGTSLFGRTGESIRDTTDRSLTFGTSTPYGIFHQAGTSRMPARPPVGLNDEILDRLVGKVADAAVEALKG